MIEVIQKAFIEGDGEWLIVNGKPKIRSRWYAYTHQDDGLRHAGNPGGIRHEYKEFYQTRIKADKIVSWEVVQPEEIMIARQTTIIGVPPEFIDEVAEAIRHFCLYKRPFVYEVVDEVKK